MVEVASAARTAGADPWSALPGCAVGPEGRPGRPGRVEEGRIADWLDVVGGPDPRPEAPRSMLSVWTMPGFAATVDGSRWAEDGHELQNLRVVDRLTAVLATAVSQTYDRPVALDEVISGRAAVRSVSGPKTTRVGPGRFVEFHETYCDGMGRRVGSQSMTLLYFRPEGSGAGPDSVGGHLAASAAELTVGVTTSLVVAGALASRDYEPVHHDAASAAAVGAPTPVLNTYTHLGFCERLVTESLGSAETLRAVVVALSAPVVAGDRVVYTLGDADPRGVRPIHATSDRGRHLSGEVRTAALPAHPEGHRP